jgi:chorismate--pyruvate lyase
MNWMQHLSRRPDAAPYRAWLTHPGSLTARLSAAHPGFHVRLLFQGRGRATPDELAVLGVATGTTVSLREVLLCADGGPLVLAHTVWRHRARDGAWRLLRGLGRRPLGHLLFTEPGVVRMPLAFLRLDRRHLLQRRAEQVVGKPLPPLWARRSVFILRGRRLLVTEVFLPGNLGRRP